MTTQNKIHNAPKKARQSKNAQAQAALQAVIDSQSKALLPRRYAALSALRKAQSDLKAIKAERAELNRLRDLIYAANKGSK